MTTQEILNILDTLETLYKARSYENEYERIFLDGQKAAIADVRYYVKLMEDEK